LDPLDEEEEVTCHVGFKQATSEPNSTATAAP